MNYKNNKIIVNYVFNNKMNIYKQLMMINRYVINVIMI